ncbi:YadA-like family protein [Negativicoccus succinicivorans]|uniref:YadA-like family protein n=1 Tax=Negativicoccus succinicivorans TaxID=620903 RepID=UPI002903786C|nr:YadA-like family protein [Negativicoccus succinicivorans]MDU2418086.1 YadA-like family protein [Negativicoccus succinicivorans]
MNKKWLGVLVGLSVIGGSTMAFAAPAPQDEQALKHIDLGGNYYYAGNQQQVSHDQVLSHIEKLNNLLEKDAGWGKTGLAAGYNQILQHHDAIQNAIAAAGPKYSLKLAGAYAAAVTGITEKLATEFHIAKEDGTSDTARVTELIKAISTGNDISKNDDEKKLVEAAKAGYYARRMETELMGAFPGVVKTVNETIDQVNTNTGAIAANTAALDTKVDKAAQAEVDTAQNKGIADNKAAIAANTGAIAANTKALATKVDKAAQAKVDAAQDKGIAANKAAIADMNAGFNDRFGELDQRVDKVGALTGALAGLKPMQYDPIAPTQIMAAASTYEGEQGFALGIAHYTKEDLMLHAGVAYDGDDDFMGNIGVTMKIGSSADREVIPERYQAGPISSVYVMQDEITDLQAKNAALTAQNERIMAELQALRRHLGM